MLRTLAAIEFEFRHVRLCAAGADSLAGDKLGAFNLSMRGHADCLNFVKSFEQSISAEDSSCYRV